MRLVSLHVNYLATFFAGGSLKIHVVVKLFIYTLQDGIKNLIQSNAYVYLDEQMFMIQRSAIPFWICILSMPTHTWASNRGKTH